ncbi:MAG: TlpA disulfide reductase family protein [Bacteroidota bacterium]
MKTLLILCILIVGMFQSVNAQDSFFYLIGNNFNEKTSAGTTFNDELGNHFANLITSKDSIVKIKIVGPQLIYFYAMILEQQFQDGRLYVEPNDTISVTVEDNKIIIRSKRQSEKVFLDNMRTLMSYDRPPEEKFPFYNKLSQIRTLWENLFQFHQKRNEYLYQQKKILKLSDTFCDVIIHNNNILYINNLLLPFNPCSGMRDFSFLKANPALIDSLKQLKNILFVSPTFSSGYSQIYYSAVLSYIRFLAFDHLGKGDEFETLFNVVESQFPGKDRDIMLTLLMKQNINNDAIKSAFFPQYKLLCSNDYYIQQVEKAIVNPSILLKDKDILATELENGSGEKITWLQLLNDNKGRIIYIDFWASWCAGCRLEMPYFQKLQAANPKITFIRISIDSEIKKWKRANSQLNIPSNAYNYCLSPASQLAQLLSKPSIPRYTLISSDGIIVSTDTFRPNDSRIKSEFEKLQNP